MYRTRVKTCVVKALQSVFSSTYPDQDYQNLLVSIEYPLTKQSYPSIWVNYEDTDPVEIASIDHHEVVADVNGSHQVTRWNFAGTVNMTMVALSSLERDNLFDQVVRLFAFARVEGAAPNDFRTIIENNEFVALNVNWDQIRPFGDGAAPGTPWGSEDEVIYENSLAFDVEGEFVSDPATNDLVLLSKVLIEGVIDLDNPPPVEFPDLPIVGPSQPFDPTHWH